MVTEYAGRIEGDPVPWTVYTKRGEPPIGFQNMKAWQAQVNIQLRALVGPSGLLEGPVVLDATFYLPWPQSAPQHREAAKLAWALKHITMKPDRTNLYKCFEDACQGALFLNDSQTIDGRAQKRYTVGPKGYTIFKCRKWTEPITT